MASARHIDAAFEGFIDSLERERERESAGLDITEYEALVCGSWEIDDLLESKL
jgi:uncharacterized protein YggL (DUF469 family)